jgi:uncharacterized protein (DUF2062 family)
MKTWQKVLVLTVVGLVVVGIGYVVYIDWGGVRTKMTDWWKKRSTALQSTS